MKSQRRSLNFALIKLNNQLKRDKKTGIEDEKLDQGTKDVKAWLWETKKIKIWSSYYQCLRSGKFYVRFCEYENNT